MNPTLRLGDRLRVVPYGYKRPCPGDVVVFLSPDRRDPVVHRVISVHSQGVRTRGDNSLCADQWIIDSDSVVGRVVYARRGGRRVCVYGGLLGQMVALKLRAALTVKVRLYAMLRSSLGPLYLGLARSGVVRRFFPFKLKTRVISFKRPSGIELQLYIGNRMIGSRSIGLSRWRIRAPFGLFIDEASLPAGDANESESTLGLS